MYYKINVSLNGMHFFATAENSIQFESELKKVYPAIKEKFPEREGYEISVTRWETVGKHVEVE